MDAPVGIEFTQFMLSRWAQLVRLGYGLTSGRHLAEDLAQTALASAYASWPRVRRSGNPTRTFAGSCSRPMMADSERAASPSSSPTGRPRRPWPTHRPAR